jgi:hypothetical protein
MRAFAGESIARSMKFSFETERPALRRSCEGGRLESTPFRAAGYAEAAAIDFQRAQTVILFGS